MSDTVLHPAGQPVEFVKAEANGNDFLIVAADALPRARWPAFTRHACDRHRGVGADGVEFVAAEPPGPGVIQRVRLALFNADGGEAEISGNGSRCVAAWRAARSGARELILDTAAGPRRARMGEAGADAQWPIDLEMGAPNFTGASLPMVPPGGELSRVWDAAIDGFPGGLPVTALSMGNPHCCIFVDAFPPDWETLGARIECHPMFPRRTNVEFIRVAAPGRLEVRIYERGVGPTQSSGTGSCAAAVAAIVTARVSSPVEVVTPGGTQTVTWAGPGDPAAPVHLHGPARIVAEGRLYFG